MREKPSLPEAIIRAGLWEKCHIPAASLEFLPVGNDSTAWAYRVKAADAAYFLKVKSVQPIQAALSVPHFLKGQGLDQIVAPLLAPDGRLFQSVGGFYLILYPFIAGRSGMEAGLTEGQQRKLGVVVKQIHTIRLPEPIAAQTPKESFSPYWIPEIHKIQSVLTGGALHTSEARSLARLWQEKEEIISRVIARARDLGLALQRNPPEFVLCHADIHTANVIVEPAGAIFIVDWDGVILAPKERDLVFVTGTAGESSAIEDADARAFFAGYGETRIDPAALSYYQYEWCVQEIGDYGARILLRDDFGEETRRESLAGFAALFRPGDVIDTALHGAAPSA